MNNTMTEIKNTVDGIKSRITEAEERKETNTVKKRKVEKQS